jgi:hypothetical protein
MFYCKSLDKESLEKKKRQELEDDLLWMNHYHIWKYELKTTHRFGVSWQDQVPAEHKKIREATALGREKLVTTLMESTTTGHTMLFLLVLT